jgi:hypothetical protein
MTEYAKNFGAIPNPMNSNVKSTAVSASTMGYLKDIRALQDLHFPPSSKKLTSGILSYHSIFFLQCGQCDDGNIIDSFFGSLYIQTLRKLPTTEPIIKTSIFSITLHPPHPTP